MQLVSQTAQLTQTILVLTQRGTFTVDRRGAVTAVATRAFKASPASCHGPMVGLILKRVARAVRIHFCIRV